MLRVVRSHTSAVLTLISVAAAQNGGLPDLASAATLAAATLREVRAEVDATGVRMKPEEGFTFAWPGLIFPLAAPVNLSSFGELALDVENLGAVSVEFGLKLSSAAAGAKPVSEERRFQIMPGATLTARFAIPPSRGDARPVLFLMNGVPPWAQKPTAKASPLDFSKITEVAFHFVRPAPSAQIHVAGLRGNGPPASVKAPEKPFPMFDRFGQYRHADWPGKIHSPEELSRTSDEEAAACRQNPRPASWDAYGGWAQGPSLPSTGFFYVTNLSGRWWFVDPLGKLFFAHGIHGVRHGTPTPVTERESWFEFLPPEDDPILGSFWGNYKAWGTWYYKEGTPIRSFNFTQANLRMKYGTNWRSAFDERAILRLPAWGMNCVGAGSVPTLSAAKRIPYYMYVVPKGPVLSAAKGYWANFYDVFDPAFPGAVRKALDEYAKDRVNDPFLVGVGVDNELTWGPKGTHALAMATLQCPETQAGKRVFVEDLKRKYGGIDGLNRAWGTSHASWEALLASTQAPDVKKAYEDLKAYAEKIYDAYFRTCRQGVRDAFPNHLYTGCRFAHVEPDVEPAAHRWCDVVSHNHYKWNVEELKPAVGNPRPLMITEFHFNAPDRGYFSPAGLLEVSNQALRAERYGAYLDSALKHPLVVGTFWFLFQHQPPSGRFDGENYSAGFVDCVDTPIPEMTRAARQVGERMYGAGK